MPNMYRPNGVSKFFRDREVGKAAGYFDSYNDVVAFCEAGNTAPAAEPTPVADDAPPAPPAPETDSDAPKPPAPESTALDIDTANAEQLRAWATELGIDPDQHHMTLRKVIRETLDAEVGAG